MKTAARPNDIEMPISSTFAIRPHRIPLQLPLIFRWMGRWFDGVARDIGVGGAFIESAEAPVHGSTIELVLDLDRTRRPMHVTAIVRWHEPGGFGVQFQLLGAYETHILTRILGSS